MAVIFGDTTARAQFYQIDINIPNFTFYNLAILKIGNGSGTVSSTPALINCGIDCVKPFLANSQVTLTAIPDADSEFAGWFGDPDCTDGVVTISTNKICQAGFTLKPTTFEGDGFTTGSFGGSIACGAAKFPMPGNVCGGIIEVVTFLEPLMRRISIIGSSSTLAKSPSARVAAKLLWQLGYVSTDLSYQTKWGTTLTQAVKLFQTAQGLSADGKIGKITKTKLMNIYFEAAQINYELP